MAGQQCCSSSCSWLKISKSSSNLWRNKKCRQIRLQGQVSCEWCHLRVQNLMVCVMPVRGQFGGVCTWVGNTYVWEWPLRASGCVSLWRCSHHIFVARDSGYRTVTKSHTHSTENPLRRGPYWNLATRHLVGNCTLTTWAHNRYTITHSGCVGIKVTHTWFCNKWLVAPAGEQIVIPGCESSSFQLISLFLTIFLCQNYSFFFYIQPIFDIFTQFHTVFLVFLSVASHTFGWHIVTALSQQSE